MWCEQCRQDVPGTASGDRGKFCCPRCGGGFGNETAEDSSDSPESADAEAGSPAESYDSWELDEQLRHIERVLGVGRDDGSRLQTACRQEAARLDPPDAGPSPWHLPPVSVDAAGKPGRTPKAKSSASNFLLAGLTWAALALGTMAFACGGVLLGWSIVGGRPELWNIGMPVTLCGQIALLVGLVLQLDRLWHNSRHAAAKLDDVDEQLHELKTATTLLGTGHNSPGGAFYSHLAAGAGTQFLLSDLKSQLDLLALKIMQQDG